MIPHESKTTDNHNTIKKWVEDRYGEPALVDGIVDKGKAGEMLRINFHDRSTESLNVISWELFFEIFEDNNLELLYQEETTDGDESKFYKFVNKK